MNSTSKTSVVIPSVGSQRNLSLSVKELAHLLGYFGINHVNTFSPLPYLCGKNMGEDFNSVNEILNKNPWLGSSNAYDNFLPLIAPDRVIDISFALFGQAPKKMRFYGNRSSLHMISVTSKSEHEIFLSLPIFPETILGWLENSLQFSSNLNFPVPFETFNGIQLAFLLALIDTYKSNLFNSYIKHKETRPTTSVSPQQIFNNDITGHQTIDRRFLVSAINEIFSELIHVGGTTQIKFPSLSPQFIESEMARYRQNGLLIPDINNTHQLTTKMTSIAADLSQWINILCLHDVQINASSSNNTQAIEEALCFIGTQTTIWSLVSEGLTTGKNDLASVNFGLRSGSIYMHHPIIKAFIQPIPDVKIDPTFYDLSIPIHQIKKEDLPVFQKYCRFCGKETIANTKFCRYCGKPLRE